MSNGPLGPGPRRWRGVALVAPFVLLMIAGMWYTNFVQQQADSRWCELIVTLDEAYQSAPPQSELGREIAVATHKLREDIHC